MSPRPIAAALRVAARITLIVGGLGLAFWGFFVATDEVFIHGFAPNCSDGSPEFDPRSCGIIWRPGLPYVGMMVAGLAAIVIGVRNRWFTGALLIGLGLAGAAWALFMLWVHTWAPVNPLYPEPAGPQLIMLGVGLACVIVGVASAPLTRLLEPREQRSSV